MYRYVTSPQADGKTDRQKDDSTMHIADPTVWQYDP